MQILVLVTGSFNKHPRGGKSPTGTALTLVLNPDLSATDFGCGDQTVTRLARLGPVHQVAVG